MFVLPRLDVSDVVMVVLRRRFVVAWTLNICKINVVMVRMAWSVELLILPAADTLNVVKNCF